MYIGGLRAVYASLDLDHGSKRMDKIYPDILISSWAPRHDELENADSLRVHIGNHEGEATNGLNGVIIAFHCAHGDR